MTALEVLCWGILASMMLWQMCRLSYLQDEVKRLRQTVAELRGRITGCDKDAKWLYATLAARLQEQSARKAYEEVASGESTRTLDVNI